MAADKTTVLYRVAVILLIITHALLSELTKENSCAMVNPEITPTWEVILRVGGKELATTAAFPDGDGKYIVLVGVREPSEVLAYADLVREAAFNIGIATGFVPVEQIRADNNRGDDAGVPF